MDDRLYGTVRYLKWLNVVMKIGSVWLPMCHSGIVLPVWPVQLQPCYLASRIFFLGWVCCTSKPALTIAIIFYSKSPWVCIANSCDFTFTHDFIDIYWCPCLCCWYQSNRQIHEMKLRPPWDVILSEVIFVS